MTSSQNCNAILRAAALDGVFDVQVDGNTIREEKLAGKPAPDMYLAPARRLGVAAARAIVVEDAISGVAAAAGGNSGLSWVTLAKKTVRNRNATERMSW